MEFLCLPTMHLKYVKFKVNCIRCFQFIIRSEDGQLFPELFWLCTQNAKNIQRSTRSQSECVFDFFPELSAPIVTSLHQ